MHFENMISRGFMRLAGKLALVTAAMVAGANAQSTVGGTVRDAATQQPIEGAMVALLTQPEFPVLTDATGSFTIDMATGLRPGARAAAPVLSGTRLSFQVAGSGASVSATLFDLRGGLVRTLAEGRYAPGAYALEAAPADLPSGIYLLHVRVGAQSRSFRLATASRAVSAPARASVIATRLAKSAAPGGVDQLVVSKAGYLKKHHEVMAYADIQAVTLDAKKAATARLGVFTDSTFGTIDWAKAVIYSWEQTAVLATDSTSIGFNGSVASMKVSTLTDMTWNGWAYHVAKLDNGTQPSADLSAYEGGSLHVAVKGNAKGIAVMISSTNQGQGGAPLIDLGAHGYLPDDAWHEITIPLSEFGATLKLTDVFVYCGFVSPSPAAEFDPLATYMVDDIWYSPAQ